MKQLTNKTHRGKRVVKEVSAGAVVFRRTPQGIVCLLLQMRDGKWVLPKGHIRDTNPDESISDAALREVREETGLTELKLWKKLGIEHWTYYLSVDDTYRDKDVHYYVVEELGTGETQPLGDEGFVKAEWFPAGDAVRMATFKESKHTIELAIEAIRTL